MPILVPIKYQEVVLDPLPSGDCLLSFLRSSTDNYRMFSESSRGNNAVFSFSGLHEAAERVKLVLCPSSMGSLKMTKDAGRGYLWENFVISVYGIVLFL